MSAAPPERPRVLLLSFSRIATDPRLLREIALLRDRCRVTVLGYGVMPPESGIDYVELPEPGPLGVRGKVARAGQLATRRFESEYWSHESVQAALRHLRDRRFEGAVAHDLMALPVLMRAQCADRLVFEAHEFSPDEDSGLVWRALIRPSLDHLCRRYIGGADACLTVSPGIADLFQRAYGTPFGLLRNMPFRSDLKPSPVDAERIRLVHHGTAIPHRHLEVMLEAVARCSDRFTLDLYLFGGDPLYRRRLEKNAGGDGAIRFNDPVAPLDLPHELNRYDVGLYILAPTNVNNRLALPNKFFEFVQARLAVLIGPSTEMAPLVRENRLGWVTPGFATDDLVATLGSVDAQTVAEAKRASHLAADRYCFDVEADALLNALRLGS